MALVGRQNASRATLVTERQQAAERLADLKVQEANVGAQHARIAAEADPALYLARLFGSNDTEARCAADYALLALLLDRLAVLLRLAASWGSCDAAHLQRPDAPLPPTRRDLPQRAIGPS